VFGTIERGFLEVHHTLLAPTTFSICGIKMAGMKYIAVSLGALLLSMPAWAATCRFNPNGGGRPYHHWVLPILAE
jgi:hypothetical protein